MIAFAEAARSPDLARRDRCLALAASDVRVPGEIPARETSASATGLPVTATAYGPRADPSSPTGRDRPGLGFYGCGCGDGSRPTSGRAGPALLSRSAQYRRACQGCYASDGGRSSGGSCPAAEALLQLRSDWALSVGLHCAVYQVPDVRPLAREGPVYPSSRAFVQVTTRVPSHRPPSAGTATSNAMEPGGTSTAGCLPDSTGPVEQTAMSPLQRNQVS